VAARDGAIKPETLVLKLYFEKRTIIKMQAITIAPSAIPSMAT
jgi:hypothetical protein